MASFTPLIVAITLGVFLALGIMKLLDRVPKLFLDLIIISLAFWLFGSVIVDVFL